MQVELSIASVPGRSCGGGMLSSSLDPDVLMSIAPAAADARVTLFVADAHLQNAALTFTTEPLALGAEPPTGPPAKPIGPVVKTTSPTLEIVPPIFNPIPQSVHFIAPAVHFIPRVVHLIPPFAQMAAGVVQIIPPAVITVPLAAQLVPQVVITVPPVVIAAPPVVIAAPPVVIAAPPDVTAAPPDVIAVPLDVIAVPQAVHRDSTRAAMTRAPFAKALFTNYLHTSSRSSLATGVSVRILRCLITSACFAVLCAFALSIVSRTFNTQYSAEKHLHNSASFPGKSRRPSLLLWLPPTAGRRASHNINVRLTERNYQ